MASITTSKFNGTLEFEALLTPAEVKAAFHVSDKTLWRWANAGLLETARTPGNHRRYSEAQVRALAGAPDPSHCDRCGYPPASLGHRTECAPAAAIAARKAAR